MAKRKMDLITNMSAAELRRLARTREQIDKLEGQKAELQKSIVQVEKDMDKLMASLTGRKAIRKKAGRKKAAKKRVDKATAKKKVQVGKKTGKKRAAKKAAAKAKAPRVTVESAVVDLLKASKAPMPFQDILATIQKKKLVTSKSKNFANVLRRTLSTSDKVKRVSRGVYKA